MRLRFPAFCFYVAGVLFLAKGLALDIAARKLDVAGFAVGVAALGVWRMPSVGTNWRGQVERWSAALGILAAISVLILLLSFTLPKPKEGGTLLLFHIPISIGALLLVTGMDFALLGEQQRASSLADPLPKIKAWPCSLERSTASTQ